MAERARGSLLALALLLAAPARAHDGPPYPVVVDEALGPWLVSVWTDPDVGTGTFYVMLDVPEGGAPPQDDTRVTFDCAPFEPLPPDVAVAPSTGVGVRQPRDRGQQHAVEVFFPTRGWWHATLVLESAATGARVQRTIDVEVTPPGLGKIDLLWYAAPFLALAFLWGKLLLGRRAAAREAGEVALSRSAPREPARQARGRA